MCCNLQQFHVAIVKMLHAKCNVLRHYVLDVVLEGRLSKDYYRWWECVLQIKPAVT